MRLTDEDAPMLAWKDIRSFGGLSSSGAAKPRDSPSPRA
jgi:hypothetical protein